MRNTKTVTMGPDAGRDAGRTYLVTEMPADPGEEWAYRAITAIARKFELPDDYKELSWATLAGLGFASLSQISWGDAKPLLDEMMDCVKFIGDPARPEITRPLIADDTEEITTRMKLRKEVFELHAAFFTQGDGLSSMLDRFKKTGATSDTPT